MGCAATNKQKDTVPDLMDMRFRVKHISLHDIFSSRVGCGAVHDSAGFGKLLLKELVGP